MRILTTEEKEAKRLARNAYARNYRKNNKAYRERKSESDKKLRVAKKHPLYAMKKALANAIA